MKKSAPRDICTLEIVNNISCSSAAIFVLFSLAVEPNDYRHILYLRVLLPDIMWPSVPHAFAFGDRGQTRALGLGAPLEALRLEFVALACELESVLTAPKTYSKEIQKRTKCHGE